jgi:hypothetical protein
MIGGSRKYEGYQRTRLYPTESGGRWPCAGAVERQPMHFGKYKIG